MSPTNQSSRSDPTKGRLLLNAMILSVFGTAWLLAWAYPSFGGGTGVKVIVALTAVFVCVTGWFYRRARSGAADEFAKIKRPFFMINAVQWLAIFGSVKLLPLIGRSDWIAPCVMFVVGVHFLPLARLFAIRAHVFTGLALMIASITYPMLAAEGAGSATGRLAAGVILWGSAWWAIVAANRLSCPRAASTAA